MGKFDELYHAIIPLYEKAEKKRLKTTRRGGTRKLPFSIGAKFTLPLEDRLLMLLIYYRCYVTHMFLGFLFGIDDSNVSRNMNSLEPLLAQYYRISERRITMSQDEIQDLFFDGTEQQIQRPKHGQIKWYSGKKKRHIIKHQVVASKVRKQNPQDKERIRVKAISKAFPGSRHDKRVYDESRATSPPFVSCYGDTAYLGTSLIVPFRTPKKQKLTPDQKIYNRIHSSLRVVVEHGIGKMKIWQSMAQRYRNKRRGHTLMMKNIAGLHNMMFA
ncbi:MAG: transposase [Chlamydiae bacterium]|nr:transposase [Chlamydiota bacterium]